MLHILLLILKIIGIIIAAILGILVLLVCIVLFVPVRYQGRVVCDGTTESLKGKVKVTWLFHLFHAEVRYKNKQTRWSVRIAWKRIPAKKVPESAPESVRESVQESAPESVRESVQESAPESVRESVQEKVQESAGIQEGEEEYEKWDEKLEEAVGEQKETYTVPAGISPESEEIEKAGEKTEESSEEESGEKIKTGRVFRWFHKIKCTFRKICDKIAVLSEQKNKISDFLEDEIHRSAFVKGKKLLLRFLRKMKPGFVDADIVYGFEDPCLTGQVLAGFSIIYPFVGEHMHVVPDFEQRIFKGAFELRGGIRICHMAALGLRLLLCRDVRATYRDVRSFMKNI